MKIIVYNTFRQLKNVKYAIALHKNKNNNYYFYIYFIKNGKAHNENFYAEYKIYYRPGFQSDNNKAYYYNAHYYGSDEVYSIKQWKKLSKKLKRTDDLKVFL